MKASASGAVLSAAGAAASWLCCLPFALGALGATGSALAQVLGPMRPYITFLSVGLLAVAFYQAYRPTPEEACATDGECASPLNVKRRRGFLFGAAGLTIVFITVPYWLDWVIYWSL